MVEMYCIEIYHLHYTQLYNNAMIYGGDVLVPSSSVIDMCGLFWAAHLTRTVLIG